MTGPQTTPPGYYPAQGDPPGTVRWWDGTRWIGEPVPPPPGYAAPAATAQQRFATVGVRIGAALLDSLVSLIVFLPIFVIELREAFDDLDAYNEQNSAFGFDDQVSLPILAAGFTWVLLSWLMIGLLGGTPGKLMLGLRITRDDGATTPPGLQLGALRVLPQVAAQVPVIGWLVSVGVTIASLVMVSQDPERRSVYDRLAGTRVVYKRSLGAATDQ